MGTFLFTFKVMEMSHICVITTKYEVPSLSRQILSSHILLQALRDVPEGIHGSMKKNYSEVTKVKSKV